jgi:cytochrome d ubiquinol oxidase subunit II
MLHFNAKNDDERRIMINAIGPVWDGNEVWLITAGGALFAAFPIVYATIFSGFYIAFMLFLLVLILRVVAIEFRSKVEVHKWRNFWDLIFNLSSYLIVLLLGISLGNIVSGIPLTNINGVVEYGGNFWSLIHPYSIFVGISAIFALRLHGLLYISIKTEGQLYERLTRKVFRALIYTFIVYVILNIWTMIEYYPRFSSTESPITDMDVDPSKYIVSKSLLLYLIPNIIIVLGMASILFCSLKKKYKCAFISSSILLVSSISLVAIAIFPNFVISSNMGDAINNINIWNGASSEKTLSTMLIIACIGVPIVLIYTIIVYKVFKGKVKLDTNSY